MDGYNAEEPVHMIADTPAATTTAELEVGSEPVAVKMWEPFTDWLALEDFCYQQKYSYVLLVFVYRRTIVIDEKWKQAQIQKERERFALLLIDTLKVWYGMYGQRSLLLGKRLFTSPHEQYILCKQYSSAWPNNFLF